MSKETCPQCNGTGRDGICGWCGGRGEVLDLQDGEYVTCRRCNGSGEDPGTCQWCGGTGEIENGRDDD